MRTVSRPAGRPTGPASAGLAAAAALGIVHGAFTLYWGIGGDALVGTLGVRMAEAFADRRRLLLPVGLVKVGFALLPFMTWARGSAVRASRIVSRFGGAVLVVWGGVNTVVGNAVLSGIIDVDGGYDREGMIGHAWLWDPMFLAWGVLLAAALLLTPAPAPSTRSSSGAGSTRPGPRSARRPAGNAGRRAD